MIEIEKIQSKDRNADYVHYRRAIARIMQEKDYTLQQTAKVLNRTMAQACYLANMHSHYIQYSPEYRAIYEALKKDFSDVLQYIKDNDIDRIKKYRKYK